MTTPRTMAADAFAPGDRVDAYGRPGVVLDVNVHAAAVVTVRHDGDFRSTPYLFTELINLTRKEAAR